MIACVQSLSNAVGICVCLLCICDPKVIFQNCQKLRGEVPLFWGKLSGPFVKDGQLFGELVVKA